MLAIVVNLVLVLVGWRALSSLPVQQYPKIESSSVVITTVYTGAERRDRPRLPDHADRARGLGDQRRRLHRVDQPRRRQHGHRAAEAQPQQHGGARRGHGAAAAGPLGAARGGRAAGRRGAARRPAVRDLLPELHLEGAQRLRRSPTGSRARCSRSSRRSPGVQRVSIEGGPPDRHAGLDRPRPARRAQPGARRRARGAAAQQLPRRRRPDEGQPRAGQPARQHRPALGRRVRQPDRRRPRRRDRAAVATSRASSSAPRRPTSSPSTTTRKASTSASGRWSGSNEIEVAHRLRAEMERMRPTLPKDIDMRARLRRHGVHGERARRRSPRR